MGHIRGKGHHRTTASHSPVRALVVVLVIVAVLVGGGWLVVRHMQAAAPVAKPDKAATVTRVDLDNKQAVPEPVVEHHGNSPDCPDTDCISMLVNGDLLFHPNLWEAFRRCEHRRHRRHGVRFHAAVRNHEAIHPGVRHRRVRVRDADRQTRSLTPAIRYSTCRRRSPMPRPRSATPPARTPPTIHGIRVPTASPACGIRSRPRASRRPVRTRPRRTPPSRWSSTRPRAAASSAWSPARCRSTA